MLPEWKRRGDPDQMRQWRFKSKSDRAAEPDPGNDFIQKIRGDGGQDHQCAHRKEPDDQRGAHRRLERQRECQKRNRATPVTP